MHRGIIAYIIIFVIILVIGYFYTGGYHNIPNLSTTTVTTVPTTSVSSTTTTNTTSTTIAYAYSCMNYSVFEEMPNSTVNQTCYWTGGRLGVWVATGNATKAHFTITGANKVVYSNGTSTFNCVTLVSNFTGPAQEYHISLKKGPLGGTCPNPYALITLNGSIVPPPTVYSQVYNANFSNGYIGWQVEGKGFGTAPLNITHADLNTTRCYQNATWQGYNGTFFATTYTCGTSVSPGNITSSVFRASKPFLNFKIISPLSNNIAVEILEDNKTQITAHFNTFNSTIFGSTSAYTFRNATIPLTSLLGKDVRIEVVSDTLQPGAYMAIGDFELGTYPTQTPGVLANISIK